MGMGSGGWRVEVGRSRGSVSESKTVEMEGLCLDVSLKRSAHFEGLKT